MYNRTETLSGAEARTFLRNWLRENGVASKLADSLTMAELNGAWTDTTNETLQTLRSRPPEVVQNKGFAPGGNETAATLILQALNILQTKAMDEERVVQLIQEHAPKPEPSVVHYNFSLPDGGFASTSERREHAFFPAVLAALSQGVHVWLVGPAGSGKTSLVGAAAKALGREYRAVSVCAQTTKTDLLGFIDAQGVYRSTPFREAFERGLVFALDEADNGNPNVLAVLNAALANGEMSFPDGQVKRGDGFVCVACANTWGNGASGGYVGRNQIDAATLDRFFFLELPLDEGLEASFIGLQGIPSPYFDFEEGGAVTPEGWFRLVQEARSRAEQHGIKVVISPRATLMGAKLAALGMGLRWLRKGLIFKALDSVSSSKLV